MNPLLIIIIIVTAIICCGLLFFIMSSAGLFGLGSGDSGANSADRLRMLVSAQRQQTVSKEHEHNKLLVKAVYAEQQVEQRKPGSAFSLSLERKLWYAKWKIMPLHFRIIQVSVVVLLAVAAFLLPPRPMAFGMAVDAALIGLVLVNSVLESAVRKRSDAFDQDYPVMLLSFVSLLKTGMSPITALENVAKSLEPISLVRQELEILVERLRLGLTEEQALGAFAEDIFHPEIELFIQALTLNMKVGGKLSSALERLARQVRKRQEFKKKAIGAVAMERGSIWAILGIMIALFVFLWISERTLIDGLFLSPIGQAIFPWTICMIIVGILWSRKVTNVVL